MDILNKPEIINRFRLTMLSLGVNQKDLARLLNVSKAAISNYLQGRIPSLEVLSRLVVVAQKRGLDHVTLDWLIFGDDQVVDQANDYQEDYMAFSIIDPSDLVAMIKDQSKLRIIQELPKLSKSQINLLVQVIDQMKGESNG